MSIIAGNDIIAADFIATSAGAGDSGKVAKLGAEGTIHSTFIRRGGTGADGALSTSSGTTTLSFASANILEKNYTSISITGTAAIAFSNPHANGSMCIMRSQGDVTITSSATRAIDLRLMGAAGGAGYVSGTYVCGDGGRGAGAIWIDCGGALNFTGTIDATGQNGTNYSGASTAVRGGGGAGAGGAVLITADIITANSGTINVTAGSAGTSLTGGDCTGTNNATSGTDAYANVGKLAGGTGAGVAAGTTTSPRFFTTTIVGDYIFLAPGSGGGGGGGNGCSYIPGGAGVGASISSADGYSLVTTYNKYK